MASRILDTFEFCYHYIHQLFGKWMWHIFVDAHKRGRQKVFFSLFREINGTKAKENENEDDDDDEYEEEEEQVFSEFRS